MIRIPAPYLRGLAVLTLGATFTLGRAALAAPHGSSANAGTGHQVAALLSQHAEAAQQEAQSIDLAESCYWEVQRDRTPHGKVVSQMVHECD